MVSPDIAILRFMNAHSHVSWTLDSAMVSIAENEFVKGLILVLFWWAWNTRSPDREKRRSILLATLPAPFVAFFAGRMLAHLLPYRVRPVADPAFHWRIAEGMNLSEVYRTWSSMPSDHAACFAAIAFSLFLVSRPIGLVALAYMALVIDLPRVYLGLHYPSDILVGTLVGFAVSALFASLPVRKYFAVPMMHFKEVRPGSFYALLFLSLYMVGCINSVHGLLSLGSEFVKAWSHHAVARVNTPAPTATMSSVLVLTGRLLGL